MFLKRLLSYFLLPFPGALVLLLVGVALLWFTARQRTGKALVTAGFLLLSLFSCGALGGWYVNPLTHFMPLPTLAAAPGVRWIVVLGAGYSNRPSVAATSRLGGDSLERLVEGIRLYRTRPVNTKLIVSGGVFRSDTSLAAVMAQAAEELGVPHSDIVREDLSDDTQDEARLIRPMVGNDPFVLVTSGFHMRRSMRLFEKQGMKPIAAPAGPAGERVSFLPQTGQLATAESAEHEYVGMIWSILRGTI